MSTSQKKHFYPVTIKETYLDVYGHVNNTVYVTLFEEARWELINQNGYGLHTITTTKLGPVILEAKMQFLKELCARDEIVIETELLSYTRKIGKLSQKMVRNHEVCCNAEFTLGLFDLKERKLVLPTQEWLKGLGYPSSTKDSTA